MRVLSGTRRSAFCLMIFGVVFKSSNEKTVHREDSRSFSRGMNQTDQVIFLKNKRTEQRTTDAKVRTPRTQKDSSIQDTSTSSVHLRLTCVTSAAPAARHRSSPHPCSPTPYHSRHPCDSRHSRHLGHSRRHHLIARLSLISNTSHPCAVHRCCGALHPR